MSILCTCLRCHNLTKPRTFQPAKGFAVRSSSFVSLREIVRKRSEEKYKNGAENDTNRQPHRERVSRPQHKVNPTNELFESLFTSTRRQIPEIPARSRYSGTLNVKHLESGSDRNPRRDQVSHDIYQLERMLYQQKAPVKELWIALSNLPGLSTTKPRENILDRGDEVDGSRNIFRDILLTVLRRWLNALPGSFSPTPREVVDFYVKNNLMKYWWHSLFWRFLSHLRDSGSTSHDNTTQNFSDHLDRRRNILNEILELWRLYVSSSAKFDKSFTTMSSTSIEPSETLELTQRTLGRRPETVDNVEWPGLPDTRIITAKHDKLPIRLKDRLGKLLPGSREHLKAQNIAVAAAVTHVYLKQMTETLKSEARDYYVKYQPFLLFAESLIQGSDLNREMLQSCISGEGMPLLVANHIVAQWEDLERIKQGASQEQQQKSLYILEKANSSVRNRYQGEESTTQGSKYSVLSNDLHNAVKHFDMKFARKLWDRLLQQTNPVSNNKDSESEIFGEFLSAFFSLGNPKEAVNVWNTMTQLGIKPTRKHWITMLDGCKRNRDLVSLQSVWQNIKASPIQADNYIFCAYISGLLHCKEWQTALKALQELTKAWNSSTVSTPPRSCTRPPETKPPPTNPQSNLLQASIEPINVTIAGLVSLRKVDVAEAVLNWALSQNLTPNILTFNILLRPYIRFDQSSKVQHIFQQMRAYNILPDAATFSIMLDALWRNPTTSRHFQNQTPEEQHAAVSKVIQDMEDSGIKANVQTYTVILNSLLKSESLNLPAARAVLGRMTEQGIRPSPHLYTTLVTYYFSTSPPDLVAIDSLWQRIQLEKTPTDHVFFDRMIEGYARVGQIDKMLKFLRLMPKEGKRTGWLALLGALKALVKVREWEMVYDLVRDVQDANRLLLHGSRGWKGEEEFWDLVETLRREGFEVPERAMVERDGEMPK